MWTSGAFPKGVSSHGMYVGQGTKRTSGNTWKSESLCVGIDPSLAEWEDSGCFSSHRTLVWQAEEAPLAEVLQLRYIPRDVCNQPVARVQVAG